MNVCIIGGGHIGTTLACYIKHHDPQKKVSLYTQHPDKFEKFIQCNDIERNESYKVRIDRITKEPSVVSDADIIFVALPHFAVEQAFCNIAPYIKKGVYIGVIPGGGGCEYYFEKYFGKNAILFGFQRVPFTAKLVTYGKETNLKSWKPFSVVGTLKKNTVQAACTCIEACGLRTRKAANFLSIALTPTNPLLHTARTYEMFGAYEKTHEFATKVKFYVGWTDTTSDILFSMDRELQSLLTKIVSIDTSAILPLSEHYESPNIYALTKKINSIPTFQTVWAPMVPSPRKNGTFIVDTNSRMFTEDFPWGLAIIRAFFDFFNMQAPTMDRVLQWYANYMGVEWYVNGMFCGNDLIATGVPQRYGILTKEALLSFYDK